MNAADITTSALPLTSSDLSLFHLFWQAHWLVKTVMTGLIVCSVWVWAIAIDKTVLFSRFRKAADTFEQAFWSGQSLEELYNSLAAKPGHWAESRRLAPACPAPHPPPPVSPSVPPPSARPGCARRCSYHSPLLQFPQAHRRFGGRD